MRGNAWLDGYFGPPIPRRDNFVYELLRERYEPEEKARQAEVDAMIAMGWGATDGPKIPEDWRTRMGPDTEGRRAKFAAAGRGKLTFWRNGVSGKVTFWRNGVRGRGKAK